VIPFFHLSILPTFLCNCTLLEALKKAGIPYQELMVKPMTSEIREQIKKDKGT
jgi:hypothetical protein